MRSATDFLPWRMIEFMNLEMTKSLNFGSGLTSRLSALCRRDIVFFLSQTNLHFQTVPRRSSSRGHQPCKKAHYLGLFAPYLERLCLRSATPCVSSTPRMM